MVDLVTELESLIAAWRAQRTAELAELIDELSSWFELVLPVTSGRTFAEHHAAWLARASTRSAVELPQLLASGARGTKDQILEQLEQLTMWEPDPRTTYLAERLIATSWLGSSTSRSLWRAVLDLIERHGDPRMLPVLRAARMRPMFRDPDRGPVVSERADAIETYLASKVATVDAASHAALVARIRGELASVVELRDGVLRADEAARSVYLDWLIDRGYQPIV